EGAYQLFVNFQLDQVDAKVLEQQGKKKEALTKLDTILTKYAQLAQMGAGSQLDAVRQERSKLALELGIVDTLTSAIPQGAPLTISVAPSTPAQAPTPVSKPQAKPPHAPKKK
ncbi:MAG TPA: hypothetical protein VFD13_06500, partial [Candidatus Kapabacteria bacterium]|nr:hypothetical protein [Candidatus Kapabacteria bacterium]